ncbi:MAG: DUF1987 domain-containing protein [Bacteroidales bacterium]|nr:DUF1987 domain-containing protein [Bacteroidales bacterium]
MKDINIEGSNDVYFVPTVKFETESGDCLLEGESFLAETVKFYTPLIEWLETFTVQKEKKLDFTFKLTYFNTSSSKCILDILKILKRYEDKGGDVVVNWHYDEDDMDMEEALEDYIIDTGVKINLIPY